MVDFFLLMQITGAGDELQGIKKGIMELADLIVVNKADGDNLQRAEISAREYNNALHYIRHATRGWQTKAQTCSAKTGAGIADIWATILDFSTKTTASGVFRQRRLSQTSAWFEDLLTEAVLNDFYNKPSVKQKLPAIRKLVSEGELPVAYAVAKLLEAAE
jgi:LAO/AO transport system kinase